MSKIKPFLFLLLLIGGIKVIFIFVRETDILQSSAVTGNIAFNDTSNIQIIEQKRLPDTSVSVSYLLGRYDPKIDISFIEVSTNYALRKGIYLHKDVYHAFLEMSEKARKEKVKLVIISGIRTFKDQKRIWEYKWSGKRLVQGVNLSTAFPDTVDRINEILKYTAMPGTSRHHWGTDIDINSVSNSYFKSSKGINEYNWLNDHAADFGFYQVYIPKGETRPYGYEEEPWHWTYLPVSKNYVNSYKNKVSYDDITGFSGAETAEEIEVIKFYVMGINPVCL